MTAATVENAATAAVARAADPAPAAPLPPLTEAQRRAYTEECLRRLEAPVKPEFLAAVADGSFVHTVPALRAALKLPPPDAGSRPAASGAGGAASEDGAGGSVAPPPAKKACRGQNHDRKANRASERGALDGCRLCQGYAAAADADCQYPACTRCHERLDAFRARPVVFAGKPCPNLDRYGLCRFGAQCAFGDCHVDAEGFNLRKDGVRVTKAMLEAAGAAPAPAAAEPAAAAAGKAPQAPAAGAAAAGAAAGGGKSAPPYVNELPEEVKRQLQRQEYVFPKRNFDAGYTGSTANPLLGDDGEGDAGPAAAGSAAADSERERAAARWARRAEIFGSGKLMLAPLTTVGNLPFRRLCVSLGAQVTMGEMALGRSLLGAKNPELALIKRHPSEKYFGVQIAASSPGEGGDATALLANPALVHCDFVDLNAACPLDALHMKGAGAVLLEREKQLAKVVGAMRAAIAAAEPPAREHPLLLSVKMRLGVAKRDAAIKVAPTLKQVGADALLIHGRTSRQRYSQAADWEAIYSIKKICDDMAVVGSGDVLSYQDYSQRMSPEEGAVDNVLIGRAALIKPWIFTEIAEKKMCWDIAATERLDLMKQFVSNGFDFWGTDAKGIEMTRRYFLEWCSFTHRYIPVGLLERTPQAINWRAPNIVGRSDLETLLASDKCSDWIKLSEMLIAPAPDGFSFIPKHRANDR